MQDVDVVDLVGKGELVDEYLPEAKITLVYSEVLDNLNQEKLSRLVSKIFAFEFSLDKNEITKKNKKFNLIANKILEIN